MSIWCRDSIPLPLEHVSTPITPRPFITTVPVFPDEGVQPSPTQIIVSDANVSLNVDVQRASRQSKQRSKFFIFLVFADLSPEKRLRVSVSFAVKLH